MDIYWTNGGHEYTSVSPRFPTAMKRSTPSNQEPPLHLIFKKFFLKEVFVLSVRTLKRLMVNEENGLVYMGDVAIAEKS